MTLLVFAALFGGSLLRRRSWRESRLGLLGRLAGLAVLIGLGAVILAQTASFFNVDNLDQGSVEQVLDRTDVQSSDGDAAFDSPRLSSPSEYPYAVVSVLFRPFPWEAGMPQALVAAAEGLVLMVLFAFSLRRLARISWYAVRTPYVAFALAYTAMFVLAFSAIGNFGLLTRQRTQVLPLVLVLLAVPAGIRRHVDEEVPPPRARMPAPRRPTWLNRGTGLTGPVAPTARGEDISSSRGRRLRAGDAERGPWGVAEQLGTVVSDTP